MRVPVLTTFISIFALAAGQSDDRCFVTNDWGSIVPGKPQVIIWDSGSFWDVLLNSGVHTQAGLAGVIARNISQNSVVWIPPKDIAQDPNQVFAVQLWDLAKGTGCVSPAFRFAKANDDDDNQETASLPPGPLVTTAVSLLNYGSITATATVATFQSDEAASAHTVTGTITGTDTAIATSNAPSNNEDSSSRPNILAIAIGAIFGILVIILIVLSILLWRARRKRARQRANSTADPKLITSSTDSRAPSVIEMDARQVAAAEMTGISSRVEMAAESKPQELPSQGMAPVELPADEVPPPRYPGDGTVSVSSLGETRRSSIDTGVFVVSPASDRKL